MHQRSYPLKSHTLITQCHDGIAHDCGVFIANALEISQSCAKPSTYFDLNQSPISITIFNHNSNSLENVCCSHSIAVHQIAAMFCICHHNAGIVAYAKFCYDHAFIIWIRTKDIFMDLNYDFSFEYQNEPLSSHALFFYKFVFCFGSKSEPITSRYEWTRDAPPSSFAVESVVCFRPRDGGTGLLDRVLASSGSTTSR